MKKRYLTLIIFAVLALVAIFTNPDLTRHKEVVKAEIHAYMQKSIKARAGSGESAVAEQTLGVLFGGALIDRMVDSIVSADNYLLFSVTKITWEGQARMIGIGVFGNVFITHELNNAMDQGLTETN